MSAAGEFLRYLADVDGAFAAEGAANPAIGQFDEKCGDLDGGDTLTFVDEVFGVFVFSAGNFEIILGEILRCEAAIEVKFVGIEHSGEEAEALGGEVLEDFVVDLRGVCTGVGQLSAGAEDGGAGIVEVEPAGVGCYAGEEGVGDFGGDVPSGEFE